jgi:uncharacterized protein
MIEFFTDLLTINFLLAFGIVILGGIMHGYTGWGGAMLMMPLMSLIYPPVEALALVVIGGLLMSVQLFPAASRLVNWRDMRALYITLIIATPIGSMLLLYMDPGLVRKVIGASIIIASLLVMSGWQYRGTRGAISAMVFGGISGVANGFAGLGGPALVMYVMAFPSKPDIQRASVVISAGLIISIILITLLVNGVMDWDVVARGTILAPAQIFGGIMGARLFAFAPQEYFKKITLVAIVFLGVSALII